MKNDPTTNDKTEEHLEFYFQAQEEEDVDTLENLVEGLLDD